MMVPEVHDSLSSMVRGCWFYLEPTVPRALWHHDRVHWWQSASGSLGAVWVLPPVSWFLQGSLDEVSFPWITLLFDTLRKILGRIKKAMSISWIDWDSICFRTDLWLTLTWNLNCQGWVSGRCLEQAEWFSWPFVPQWILVYWGNIVFLSLLYTSRVTIGCSTPSSTWVQVWHSCEIRAGIGLSMAPRCTFLLCYGQSQMTFSCYSYVIVYTLFSKFRMIILTQLNFYIDQRLQIKISLSLIKFKCSLL